MIVCGIIGAALASVVLGLTRMYKEVGVFALGMCVLCSIWFLEVSDPTKSPAFTQVGCFHAGLQV